LRLASCVVPGYTPFDRDNQVEEIQAICSADYAFEPVEYWQEVSNVGEWRRDSAVCEPLRDADIRSLATARDFISRCLTIDPTKRITAHQALEHPWLVAARGDPTKQAASGTGELNADLLPAIKKQFDPRQTFR
jgi:serine/threonine protein kinase